MFINADAKALERFLENSEDAEALGGGEYTVDLYDAEEPMSLDLAIEGERVRVLAALKLLYSDAEDGWYLGEAIEDAAAIEKAIAGQLS